MGAPGSGKSTWAKQQDGAWISRDAIRFSMLHEGDHYFEHEDEVYKEFIRQIQDALQTNENVYADASHLNWPARNKLLSHLNLKGVNVGAVVFVTPLNTCFERNDTRTGHANVPHSVIRRMYYSFQHPRNDPFSYFMIKEI